MFGKNIIMKVESAEQNPSGMLTVHSLFYTIQGEGPFAGRAAVFVRLHGCSLACSWCDTEFESLRVNYAISDLLRLVGVASRNPDCRLIVLTGGEPTRQNIAPFIRLATNRGYEVQIETAGIHCTDALEDLLGIPRVTLVCSPKTAKIHRDIERYCMHYKYIIDAREQADPRDGLPMWAVSQRNQTPTAMLYRPVGLEQGDFRGTVWVQPMDVPDTYIAGDDMPSVMNKAAERKQRNWENLQRCTKLVMGYGYRLSVQVHKIAELP